MPPIDYLLHRLAPSHQTFGTFGLWCTPEHLPIFATIEDPWIPSLAHVDGGQSCIQAGLYRCQRASSPLVAKLTHGRLTYTFEITGVPGRTLVRIHPANTSNNAAGGALDDVRGCVGVGLGFDHVDGQPGIVSSVVAFERLILLLRNRTEFGLLIEWGVPGEPPA